MESTKIYEECYKEILSMKKSLSSDVLNINFTKLDNNTAGELRDAISTVLSRRSSAIYNVIAGTERR